MIEKDRVGSNEYKNIKKSKIEIVEILAKNQNLFKSKYKNSFKV